MSVEIQWTDIDPATGKRRYVCVHRFAGRWWFKWKLQRRGEWTKDPDPALAMWERVLDGLQRRYRRREGVSDEDIEQVTKIVEEKRRNLEH